MSEGRINILLIDDDEEDFLITRDIISDIPNRNYHLDWVSNYANALGAIAANKHDVCLVDYRLGAENGLDLIRAAIKNGCRVPLILLTGQDDNEIDEMALEAGAADYLIKGNFEPYLLDRSLRYNVNEYKYIGQIQKLNRELEERVEERTLKLEQAIVELNNSRQEIISALQKEKELSEMKSRFVTIASHEFRTPLSTILSSTILIGKYADDDKEKREKQLGRIRQSVKNLTKLLENFLSLSKLEEGKIEINSVHFNLFSFSEDLVEDLSSLTAENQQIILSYSGNEEVFLDKQILQNILINLITNALKYSSTDKNVFFTVDVKESSIHISVEDNGIGIPEEEQKHLFERFFRARNALNLPGTGLGLHIIKKYVEMLGGEISFQSKVYEGTRFNLNLPNSRF